DTFWKKIKAVSLAAEVDGVLDIRDKLSVVPGKNPADEAVAEEVVAALERNTGVDVDKINVSVENGVVTLSGTVTDYPARRAAEETARCTAGVTGINNNLVIEPINQE
ncbi:MAG: BON domain-containing protein, partial [Endomicrobiales bacterium]